MNDIQVRSFMEAARTENFTKAAENLFVAQSALSRNIASLEYELGVKLFVRERKKVCLSNAGKIYYDGFKKLYEDFEKLSINASIAMRSDTRTIYVGIAEGQPCGEYYAEKVNQFLKAYPEDNIRLIHYSLRGLKRALINQEIDMAFIAEKEASGVSAYVDFYPTRRERSKMAIPTTHPKANEDPLSLDDFKDDIFIVLDNKESKTTLNKDNEQSFYHKWDKVKVAPDIGTLAMWVEAGQGISALNPWHYLKDSPVVKFVDVEGLYLVQEGIAVPKNNRNPAVDDFLSIILDDKQSFSG